MAVTVKKKGAYSVGYKKPPQSTQFKPGLSGNPKGRPKWTKNLKTDLEEELQERIDIKEGGAPKKVSKQRAIIKSQAAKAAGGDPRAANLLFAMVMKLLKEEVEPIEELDLTAADKEILEKYAAKILSKPTAKEKSNAKL